jgi:hypothetical protein
LPAETTLRWITQCCHRYFRLTHYPKLSVIPAKAGIC